MTAADDQKPVRAGKRTQVDDDRERKRRRHEQLPVSEDDEPQPSSSRQSKPEVTSGKSPRSSRSEKKHKRSRREVSPQAADLERQERSPDDFYKSWHELGDFEKHELESPVSLDDEKPSASRRGRATIKKTSAKREEEEEEEVTSSRRRLKRASSQSRVESQGDAQQVRASASHSESHVSSSSRHKTRKTVEASSSREVASTSDARSSSKKRNETASQGSVQKVTQLLEDMASLSSATDTSDSVSIREQFSRLVKDTVAAIGDLCDDIKAQKQAAALTAALAKMQQKMASVQPDEAPAKSAKHRHVVSPSRSSKKNRSPSRKSRRK